MSFKIWTWFGESSFEDIGYFEKDANDNHLLFATEKKALDYARNNINNNYRLIEWDQYEAIINDNDSGGVTLIIDEDTPKDLADVMRSIFRKGKI